MVAPELDEGGSEVAGGDVREGEHGGLKVGKFKDVGLDEGDAFLAESGEDDAFNVAMRDAFCGGRMDVLREFVVVKIHEGDADSVAERERHFCQDVVPVSMPDQGEDGAGIRIV